MGGKNVRKDSPKVVKSRTPKKTEPSASIAPDSLATPTRKRQRASDFATKKSSAKKRGKEQSKSNETTKKTPKKTPRKVRAPGSEKKKAKAGSKTDEEMNEARIEDMMVHLREMVEKEKEDGLSNSIDPQLAEALKKADDAFECDVSDSDSSFPSDNDDHIEAELPTKSKARNGKEVVDGAKKSDVSKKTGNSKTSNESKQSQVQRKKSKEQTPASSRKKKKTVSFSDDEAEHQAEIEALKKEDPEFYRFLEENDASLLDFNISDSDEEAAYAPKGKKEKKQQNRDGATKKSDADGNAGVKSLHESSDESGSDESDDGSSGEESPKNVARSASKHATPEKPVEPIDANDSSSSDDENDSASEPETSKEQIAVPDSDAEDSVVEVSDKELDDDSDSDSDVIMDDEDPSLKNGVQVDMHPAAPEGDYSEDEDEDSDAEAEAAAEAGLQANSENSEDESESVETPENKKPKTTVVNSEYLKGIEQTLKSNRTSLKAVKDLLRIFRAGRELLGRKNVGKAGKEKKGKHKKKSANNISSKEVEQMEEDEFHDDGAFTSGKVTFTSATVYQKAMNMAIINIQDALDRMLGKPKSKNDDMSISHLKWNPVESGRWLNLQPVLRPYVFHMISMCEEVTDPKTVRFLLKRLENLIPYTQERKGLLKKLTRIGGNAWAAKEHHASHATRLRAYLLIRKLAHSPGNAETVLRICCNVYTLKIGNVCNTKTLPLIQFASSCLVELFGIDMGASYSTAFSSLREMAVALRVVLTSKEAKEEVERIHNWSYINRLRLWSMVLSKYGGAHELQPLIYPFVQVSLGIMRVQPTPRTYPLRLHVASYLSDVTGSVGTFIPVVPHLLALLRCSELRKKPAAGKPKVLEWRSLLRVNDDMVKTKPYLSGIIDGVVAQLAKYFASICRHVSFPEVSHSAEMTLRKFAKELVVNEWRTSVSSLVEKISESSGIITEARSKADFSPHGAVGEDGMLSTVPGLNRDKKMPMERLYEVIGARIEMEERNRDEIEVDEAKAKKERKGEEEGDERPKKKVKFAKEEKGRARLNVPEDDVMTDEEDEVGELSLDSDSSDEE